MVRLALFARSDVPIGADAGALDALSTIASGVGYGLSARADDAQNDATSSSKTTIFLMPDSRTYVERIAHILHTFAHMFTPCPAHRRTSMRRRSKRENAENAILKGVLVVGAQGIEPWTSPV